jgi:hypothetical protein
VVRTVKLAGRRLCPSVPSALVTVLSDADIESFAAAGYLVVPGLVGDGDLVRVDAEVDRLIAERPPPEGHAGPHFYWQSPTDSPALFVPLDGQAGILAAAGELTVPGQIRAAFDQAQVALNLPPFTHRPGRHHLDGYAADREIPATFTMLAGLLLNDQTEEDTGTLWVWPGTHCTHAAYFAKRSPAAFNLAGGYPDIELPEPVQICGRRGDVLLAHYLLGHNIGGNYASSRTRRAVYWRLRSDGHAERWEEALQDEWVDYEGVRRRSIGR